MKCQGNFSIVVFWQLVFIKISEFLIKCVVSYIQCVPKKVIPLNVWLWQVQTCTALHIINQAQASAVPTVEATEAVASAKIDIAQLKRLVIIYRILLYKLATRFADSFEIIAITGSALFNTKCTVHHKPFGGRAPPGRKQYAGPHRELAGCAPLDLVTILRLRLD